MLKVNKIPKVLFIKGIFKKDCMTDDIFDKRILENIIDDKNIIDDSEEINISYTKLPAIFENIDSWPKSTNLLCWNCHQSFRDIPVFIPGVIEPMLSKNNDSDKQRFAISVHGVFSSFGCAFSYVDSSNYSLTDRTEIYTKLRLLHKLFYGNKIKDVSYFPSVYKTVPYGGDKTIDEFRSEMEKFKKENISK